MASQAAVIISPVSATASSEFSGDYDIGNTIDQSGLSIGFISGVTNFDAYIAQNPTHTTIAANFEWFTQENVVSATVNYDLGQTYLIDRLALWNEESSGIGSFDISVSTDNVNFTQIATGLVPFDNPLANYPAEIFSFGSVAARYVRFGISQCPQPNPGSFNGCGIGEVAFSVVPEPLTIMGTGAALGFGAFFKRKTSNKRKEHNSQIKA
ncbi:PEP-CTERM sorting domain-containing protein [Gloeothece citriformis]|nr:PEP-CTERM sorting domain-containing protein [Gloeothece citriformis]